MRVSEQTRLKLIVNVVRQEVLRGWQRDSCIASSRVLSEVLRYFGYTSEPFPVSVCAFNKAGFERLNTGDHDVANWPEEAWSVGIQGSGVSKDNRWDGHLVLLVDGRWLVDPSLDQVSRPQRGIELHPAVLDTGHWADKTHDAWAWRDDEDGTVLMYAAMAEPGDWRRSADWMGHKAEVRTTVASVIRTLKPLLEAVA